MAGSVFSRSVSPTFQYQDPPDWLMKPNPREISLKLLARKEFLPATTLNLLAAAWIQFQVHGWVRHIHDRSHWLEIPVSADDPWPNQKPMTAPSSFAQINQNKAQPLTFINDLSHWWDGSQIYGHSEDMSKQLRSFKKGKLKVLANGLLPTDPETILT